MRSALKNQGFGRRRRAVFWPLLLAVSVCLIGGCVLLDASLRPIAEKVAAQRVHLAVVRLINEAVYDQLGNGVAYQQLINVSTDANGQVTLMQPDTVKITRLVTSIARDLEEKLSNLSRSDIEVPLGLLTGNVLLADSGPNLVVALLPLGSVATDIHDEFTAAGINQTKHTVMLDITVDVGILLPFQTTFTEITDTLPIVESVIVGPIPDTYLSFGGAAEGLSGLISGGEK